jgi:hypothetical protein
MEATLKFNLPEDDFEYKLCNQASDMWSALMEFKEYMRDELKYNDNLIQSEFERLEVVQTKFFEIINNNNIKLDL